MYENAEELLRQAQERGVAMAHVVMENEAQLTGEAAAVIRKRVMDNYRVMQHSAKAALDEPGSAGCTLIAGQAAALDARGETGIMGRMMTRVMVRALSCLEVNASMGKICAAPTAGACGILPAVVITLSEQMGCGEEKIIDALLTASGIGAIVMKNATVSGATGGCQAECGVAGAMAAAAAVHLLDGSDKAALCAASLALMSCMGLICDPVGGLVQIPCAYRNATQAVSAIACAQMALSGIDPRIPFDQTVSAMAEVGAMLPPALRETARGGVAATPAARELVAELWEKQRTDSQITETGERIW